MTHAYNYDTQQWLSGAEAESERERQNREDRALLERPRGADYARFMGLTDHNKAMLIVRLKAELGQ